MSETAQRVVVIQDASRCISSEALRGVLRCLQLKQGDEFILLGVLQQVNTGPSTFPFMGGRAPLGYKGKVDSSSSSEVNKKIMREAIAKKIEEYKSSVEILQIRKLYEIHEVKFSIKVVAASSPKIVALVVAEKLEATWIILDRQMKKDKKYFLEKLSCGISKIKRRGSVEQLRGPKDTDASTTQTVGNRNSYVTYDEMIPGTPDDDDLFSLELSPTSKIRSPLRNNSVEELRKDNEKASPGCCAMALSSKSASSEHLQSLISNIQNTEASSNSYFNEAKHSPLHMQQVDLHESTKREAANELQNVLPATEELDQIEQSEMLFQNTGQKQSRVESNFLVFGLGWQPGERFENSVCQGCSNERPKIGSIRDFTYAELEAATAKFCEQNYLSEGGFGSVYKGQLKNGQMIAVKQHKDASSQGEREFKAEVHVLSKARHKNVVMLLGSCSEDNNRLLVYEFVCNGSLDKHLSENPRMLSWTDRIKIALGAASGLNYLHENNIIHRDMRPNNILVTHDYEPLVGDFGLARTQNEESDHSSGNKVVGTIGYLAPEYAESGKASTKMDVYSFGVVLLELITGRTTVDKRLGAKSLVGWARPLLKERKYPDLIDSSLADSHDVLQLFWMVWVVEKCLSKDSNKRLSMDKVVWALKRILDGMTVTGIEDFFQANALTESNETQENTRTFARRRLITDVSSISSRSQISEVFSSASSAETSTRSSTTSRSSNYSTTNDRKSYKKKGSKSGNQTQVLYGEMFY